MERRSRAPSPELALAIITFGVGMAAMTIAVVAFVVTKDWLFGALAAFILATTATLIYNSQE